MKNILHISKLSMLLGIAGMAALCMATMAHADAVYVGTVLPDVSGAQGDLYAAVCIDGNTVGGTYHASAGGYHGFIATTNSAIKFDFPGADSTEIDGMSGTNIVGTYYKSGPDRGFIYDGHTFKTLDAPGAGATIVTGVSGNTVVGWFNDTTNYARHGFIYNGSTFKTLDYPGWENSPQGYGTFIKGISDGIIFGWTGTQSGGTSFIYNGSTFTNLLGRDAAPAWIGEISGSNFFGGDQYGGFIYDGSTFEPVILPDQFTGVTCMSGDNFGGTCQPDGKFHAFLAKRLPKLVTALNGSGLSLTWNGTGCKLQSTPSLVPPVTWTDVPGAVSGHIAPISGASQFYRLAPQ